MNPDVEVAHVDVVSVEHDENGLPLEVCGMDLEPPGEPVREA